MERGAAAGAAGELPASPCFSPMPSSLSLHPSPAAWPSGERGTTWEAASCPLPLESSMAWRASAASTSRGVLVPLQSCQYLCCRQSAKSQSQYFSCQWQVRDDREGRTAGCLVKDGIGGGRRRCSLISCICCIAVCAALGHRPHDRRPQRQPYP